MMSEPSLMNTGWGLSLTTNTTSAGILLGVSSPSLGKVIFVPSFQPRLMSTIRILSSLWTVRPSGLSLFLEIFIFFVQPEKTSSRLSFSSCTTGGSFFFVSALWWAPGVARKDFWKPPMPPSRPLPKAPKGSLTSISSSPFWGKKWLKGLRPPKNSANIAWGSPWKL